AGVRAPAGELVPGRAEGHDAGLALLDAGGGPRLRPAGGGQAALGRPPARVSQPLFADLGPHGARALAPPVRGHAMSGFERQWKGRFEKFATRHEPDHLVAGWSLAGLRRRMVSFEGLLDGGLTRPGARALELGCGAGTYVRLLAKRGHPVIG